VHLGAGNEGDRGEGGLQQPCILDDEAVRPEIMETMDERNGFLQLVVVQEGVEGDVDPGPEAVGIKNQGFDLLQGVARLFAGPETGAPI